VVKAGQDVLYVENPDDPKCKGKLATVLEIYEGVDMRHDMWYRIYIIDENRNITVRDDKVKVLIKE